MGDDNALCITECTVVVSAARPCPPEVRVTKLLSIPHAHSSSITGKNFYLNNVCACKYMVHFLFISTKELSS